MSIQKNFNPDRCKEEVQDSGGWHWYQCQRKPKKDGFCKQHHPDTIAEKQRKSKEKFDKGWDLRRKQLAGPRAISVLNQAHEHLKKGNPNLAQKIISEFRGEFEANEK